MADETGKKTGRPKTGFNKVVRFSLSDDDYRKLSALAEQDFRGSTLSYALRCILRDYPSRTPLDTQTKQSDVSFHPVQDNASDSVLGASGVG
jgi:hypothetical protein